jgi:hypothetical protein
MGHKVSGSNLAVGFWGRSLWGRIQADQTGAKEKALEQDKLLGLGRRVFLWNPVGEDTPGSVPCTCDKETASRSDARCFSCYGARRVPGMLKFLHETIFFASAEYTGFTLTNVVLDDEIKPHRLRLADAALTGTILTPDKAFENPLSQDWMTEVQIFHKVATDTSLVEFSTDGGSTFTNIDLINGPLKPIGDGLIRFRITLTRVAITTEPPDFEILRVRHLQPDRANPQVLSARLPPAQVQPGEILILRPWIVEQTSRTLGYGRQIDFMGDRSWTVDLAFFDKTITPNTFDGVLHDREAGPHPMYEMAEGVSIGERFVMYQVSYNDQLQGVLTQNAFLERRSQEGELYGLVF